MVGEKIDIVYAYLFMSEDNVTSTFANAEMHCDPLNRVAGTKVGTHILHPL